MSPTVYHPETSAPDRVTAEPARKQITAEQAFNIRGLEIGQALDAYAVPKEKIEAVVRYYGTLLAKNKQMSNGRIVRKTVEYFKLKKKEVASESNL